VLLTSWVEFFIIAAISIILIFGAESLPIILAILLALVLTRKGSTSFQRESLARV
jgi:hypothetical protein